MNTLSETKNPQKIFVVTAKVDIFTQPSQTILVVYKASSTANSGGLNSASNLHVKSIGLGVDIQYSEKTKLDTNTYSGEYNSELKYQVGNSKYDSALKMSGSKEQLSFLLKILNTDLLKASSKLSITKDQQVVDTEISSYDNLPILSHLEIKNTNTLLFTIGYKSKFVQ